MSSDHSLISPSMFFRVRLCPGSVLATKDIPEPPANPAAERGTAIHLAGEDILLFGSALSDIDQEGMKLAHDYADYVRGVAAQYDDYADLYVELKVDLDQWIPNGRGSADAVVFDARSGHLHIIDLKTGAAPVNPDGDQLRLYALGAMAIVDSPVKHVWLHIYQANNIGIHEITDPGELEDYGREVKAIAERALQPGAPFNPSDAACKWCRFAPQCPALHTEMVAIAEGDFDNLPAIDSLTDEQIAKVVLNKAAVEKWLRRVYDHAADRARAGNPVHGTKLVEGKSRRVWLPDAEEQLKDYPDAWEQKLIGITAADKVFGKGFVDRLTRKEPYRPQVVGLDDKRPAIESLSDFDNLDN